MDSVNRRAWSEAATVRWFRELEGWTDEGERVALESVADEVRGEPILDLGVGAGRTVPLLRALSGDYAALDYTPELVEACRAKYPDVNVALGDARDLSRFRDRTFQLVVFSFNGIDAVNREDRVQILHEAHRVLRDDGIFLFSAHNRQGPGSEEGLSLGVHRTRNPFKLVGRVAQALLHAGETIRNYQRYSKLTYQDDDYAIRNAAAHQHAVLFHYTSLEGQLRQLEDARFRRNPVVIGSTTGRVIARGDDVRNEWWFHFVARK